MQTDFPFEVPFVFTRMSEIKKTCSQKINSSKQEKYHW